MSHKESAMNKSAFHPRQTGWTLVDAAIALAIASILVSNVIPPIKRLQDEQRIKSIASLLRTDLQLARSSAVSLGEPVRLQVLAERSKVCYALHRGPVTSCTCASPIGPSCESGSLVGGAAIDTKGAIQLSSTTKTLNFDGTVGTVTPTATFTLADDSGNALKVIVNVMGRVRTCTASGKLSGFPRC
jgi:type IV fimbrial biogenesis protein FimT